MNMKGSPGNFLIGILVGAASWLPGISGGVIAVTFGVYERLIDDISNLRTRIREDLAFLLSLGLGIAAGLFAAVFILDRALAEYLLASMFIFVGLIIGQLPELVRITKRNEPTRLSHAGWFALGAAVMMLLLALRLYLGEGETGGAITDADVHIGLILSFLAGAVFAISKIVPGISGSTVLLALGLFVWMNHMIASFDILYLLPFGVGFVIAVFAFAKVMGHLLRNYHHQVYYFILGLTAGSVIMISAIALDMKLITGYGDVLIAFGAAAAGALISLMFTRIKTSKT